MLDVGMMYHPKETKYPGGFFTSVPLKSSTNSYGALFVVGKSQSNVTSYDLKILETIGDNAGAMLEHFLFKTMLKNNSMVETSGILNEAAFINRLEEEINKSKDVGNKLALCLFTVDKLGVIDPEIHPDRAERVSKHVTEIFRKYLKSYYPMGKIRENIYGIVITEMNGPDSHRWAEKIRSEIARTPIEIDNKRYYITVSIGIAEKGKGETIVSLADNAMVALNLSEDKSNKVTLYE
jgi:GGDEF domain-containing protein